MNAPINLIVIHCAATRNGQILSQYGKTAAERIDTMHAQRGFHRASYNYQSFNPHLQHIGYHFVIDTDGTVETGRAIGETGAHVRGHNQRSIGICMVGTDAFTIHQWHQLGNIIAELAWQYPDAEICGHRDLSPDLDGDGTVEPYEWTKICPGFNVDEWIANDAQPITEHTCEVIPHAQT